MFKKKEKMFFELCNPFCFYEYLRKWKLLLTPMNFLKIYYDINWLNDIHFLLWLNWKYFINIIL